jgi:hypothetical protein
VPVTPLDLEQLDLPDDGQRAFLIDALAVACDERPADQPPREWGDLVGSRRDVRDTGRHDDD